MNLRDAVLEAFAPGGVLACTVDEFRGRSGQIEMALAVADAIARLYSSLVSRRQAPADVSPEAERRLVAGGAIAATSVASLATISATSTAAR